MAYLMMEFELKLEIPADRLAQVEAAVREGKAVRQHLQARYFDTGDGALARHGIVLRVRKEGRRWVQTAKGPTSGPLSRLEHNVSLVKPPGAAAPVADLARHAGTPVGERIMQALGLESGEAFPGLLLLYETDVWRLTRNIELAGSVMEIALDVGRVVSGPHSIPLCELEVELKDGSPEHAVQLASEWCGRHGLWLSSISKSMKGQRLASGSAFGPAVPATPPEFDRHANSGQIAVAILQSCLAQVLGNASEMAGGSDNPDHIHQLRVGIRRLRTALRELSVLTGGIDPAWEAPLVEAFRALGQHRDSSHVMLSVQPQIEAAGGPAVDTQRLDADLADPALAVRSPAFQDAVLGIIGFVHGTPPQDGSLDPKAAKKVLRQRLKKLRSQVVKEGRKFLSLEESRQHQVRKRLKRLRYLAEFVAPLFSARKFKKFITSLKPVQDALGLYNDELTALAAYRALTDKDKNAWFGVGWLSARRAPNALACLHELEAFSGVRPFWE